MARPVQAPKRPRSTSQDIRPSRKKKKVPITHLHQDTSNRIPIPIIAKRSRDETYPKLLSLVKPMISLPSQDDLGYKSWVKTFRSRPKSTDQWESRLAADPATLGVVKDALKKAKKGRNEDEVEKILGDAVRPKRLWFQQPIHLQDTRRILHSQLNSTIKKERAPSSMKDIFGHGRFGVIKALDSILPVDEKKVDKLDALELRPILLPEDAKAVQGVLKDHKSRLRPYIKKASGPIDEDPIWDKWAAKDNSKLKNRIRRARPPLFPINQSELHGPVSLQEVYLLVENSVPELSGPVEYQAEYGKLECVLLDKDPLDMAVLLDMDPPTYHRVPKSRSRSKNFREAHDHQREKKHPMLTRLELVEMQANAERVMYHQDIIPDNYRPRRQTFRFNVPAVCGLCDSFPKSYNDFLLDDEENDPWLVKLRGTGQISSKLDWDSFIVENPGQYHFQAANCDTETHRRRYGTPGETLKQTAKTSRLPGQPLRNTHPLRRMDKTHHRDSRPSRSRPRSRSGDTSRPHSSNQVPLKRKHQPDPPPVEDTGPNKIDPRLDMGALRDIVLIPEAKIDRNKIRTIEPMATAHELASFFSGLTKPKSPTAAGVVKTVPKQVKGANAKDKSKSNTRADDQEWRKHKSIQNPKWYGGSIRLSASETDDSRIPVPIIIAAPILQNRPLYRALECINFVPVEKDSPHVQHVDFIVSPSTGIIFHPLAKLEKDPAKLLHRLKSAAFYYTRVVLVIEVIPFRLFKDPKSVADLIPINEGIVKALSAFKRGLEVGVNSQEGLIGSAEIVFAANGAEEVASMLRGLSMKLDGEMMKGCHGGTLGLWQDKSWIHKEIDPMEEEYLVSAGFNTYSTTFILALCGSFEAFAGLTAKERIDRIGPIVGLPVINRFNAKWWKRQVENRKPLQIQSVSQELIPATSETLVLGSG